MKVGDRVEITGGSANPIYATVVCVISPPQFTDKHPEAQWAYLKTGVMVETDDGILMHYPDGLVDPAMLTPDGPTWSVWREDDNGNRFRMAAGMAEDEAWTMADDYTRRSHKQRYWAQRDGPAG